MKKRGNLIVKILIYLCWAFILAVGIGDLFYIPSRSIVWFASFVVLIFVYIKFKNIPNYVHLLLVFVVLTNIFGEIFSGLFYRYMSYDKLLHLINPVIISILFYYYFRDKIKDKKILLILCVSLTLSLELLWEIFEAGFDYIFKTQMQGVFIQTGKDVFGVGVRQTMDQFADTIWDMVDAVLGSIIFVAGFYFYQRRRDITNNHRNK